MAQIYLQEIAFLVIKHLSSTLLFMAINLIAINPF